MNVIGIDQGTTGTFVGLMNESGAWVQHAYKSHHQFYPQPGWVEQNPHELWHNVCELLNEVIGRAGISPGEIAGLGLANQGESVMLWNRVTGQPLHNALIWQDTRTEAGLAPLASDTDLAREVRERTGLKIDSYFSASKIRWLLDHCAGDISHDLVACGTLDTWIIWKLTDGRSFVTDVSTAARTLLFNIHTLRWDQWLLDLFGIPLEILPTVMASTAHFGDITSVAAGCVGVPIVASLVDQPAAMIGQGCLSAGQIKATYGTGCFINLNTGSIPVSSQHGLLTILTWQRENRSTYGLEGGVFTAGASLNWLRDKLGFFEDARQIDELCAGMSDSGGAMWIPAQVGLGAPYWNRTMRGAWFGIDLTTTVAQLTWAVLEGIAARVAQIVDAMQDDAGLVIGTLRVDGGLTGSNTLMQIQANLLGKPVEVLANPEATASGTCALAARAVGMWTDDNAIRQQVHIARTYTPQSSENTRQTYLKRFDRAIRHLEAWYE